MHIFRFRRSAILLLLVLGIGCEPQPQPVSVANSNTDTPPTDRYQQVYAPLRDAQYQVLADFESPEQMALFTGQPPANPPRFERSAIQARQETGQSALRMSLNSSIQSVTIAGDNRRAGGFIRDWRPYQLLLLSVYSPRSLGGFRLTIDSGREFPLSYELPRKLLNPGWNLIRVDLGDLADHLDLAEVRALRLSCNPLDTPVDLFVDDIILADNSRTIFGSPTGTPGSLYIHKKGQRLVAGAVGRFELVFLRGRIEQWYDLESDPLRVHNLIGVEALGPTPFPLMQKYIAREMDINDPAHWQPLGIAVETYQGLLDVSPISLTIQGQWRFLSGDAQRDERGPAHHWLYTLYPDGRVYIECSGTSGTENFQPSHVGIAFNCDMGLGFTLERHDFLPPEPDRFDESPNYALFFRPDAGQSDLLVVPHEIHPQQIVRPPGAAGPSVAWVVPTVDQRFFFTSMLQVWPTDLENIPTADEIARLYVYPPAIHVSAGTLVRNDPGDVDQDGFSEGRGYYTVELVAGRAQLNIDHPIRPPFSPLFKVLGVANREIWVYVNGKSIENIIRDPDGNAMFGISPARGNRTLIEIGSRPLD